jgi:Cu2+-exporting ATPase/Cu+-exporting ATPase
MFIRGGSQAIDNRRATPSRELACSHCGLKFHTTDIVAAGEPWFCCSGCRTVYQLLQEKGLGRFYDLKREGYCLRPATPANVHDISYGAWDSPRREHRLYLEGVHCSACLWLIEQLPNVLPQDVQSARLDLGHSMLKLQLTPDGQLSKVARMIDTWGYFPHLIENTEQVYDLQKKENRSRLIDLGVAGALAGNIMLMSIPLYSGVDTEWARFFTWISAGLATVSVFYSGRKFFQNVWASLSERQFSIDAPILLAIMVAYGYSMAETVRGRFDVYFDSLSSLIFLLLASRYLLARLRQYGLGQRESFQFAAPPSQYKVGTMVVLHGTEPLGFDGIIRSGRAFVNTAVLTGESFPVEHRVGDKLYAGTEIVSVENGADGLGVEVTAVGAETRIENIFRQLREKQQERSRREKSFDLWARRLLMFVVGVAAVTFTYFVVQGQWDEALRRTLALLIVTCPCALALATPLAQTLILRRGLQRGLLIKDVDAFEEAADIQKIIFDKTGTLTYGHMQIEEMNIPKNLRPLVRALVRPSRHPVSRAIFAGLGDGECAILEDWTERPGLGIQATYRGDVITLMKPKNLKDSEERPAVELMFGGDLMGQIFLSDRIREESQQMVADLREKGFELGLLSGDREPVVRRIAMDLNFRKSEVHAEASPEEKAEWIKKFEANGEKVLFIGDGVNDALAMSFATLSFAVQGGVENVLKSASVAALRSGLAPVRSFFELAQKLRSLHRMNFVYSTFYNTISGALAVLGLMNPLIAAVVMPLSALTVFVATYYSVGRKDRGEV